jgi:hypothetical protein
MSRPNKAYIKRILLLWLKQIEADKKAAAKRLIN